MGSVSREVPGPFDVKSVAIIGAGPSGLAAAKYLVAQPAEPSSATPSSQSGTASHFTKVTIYEQQPKVGGVWYYSSSPVPSTPIPQTSAVSPPDPPVRLRPGDGDGNSGEKEGKLVFPSPMYDVLNTNIPHTIMKFSDFPFTDDRGRTIDQDADLRIFPEREVVHRYLEEYSAELEHLIRFSTSILSVRLRADGSGGKVKDQWDVTSWDNVTGEERTETYDALVVAGGHYNTTYVPDLEGIRGFDEAHPGVISHSKTYRSQEKFRGKKVLVVGNSASGLDIANQINEVCQQPLLVSVRTPTPDDFRKHIDFKEVTTIAQFLPSQRGVRLADGTEITDLDAVLFCTGYLFTLPFFKGGDLAQDEPPLITDGRRIRGLYRHLLHIRHPTLAFPGLPMKVIPFPFVEAQAAVFARVWANELELPPTEEMEDWERRELEEKGEGKYHVFPPFADGKFINETYDRVVRESARGKLPPRWDDEQLWQRSIYAEAKIKFEEAGKTARTLKELGLAYDPEKKAEKLREAKVEGPALDAAV